MSFFCIGGINIDSILSFSGGVMKLKRIFLISYIILIAVINIIITLTAFNFELIYVDKTYELFILMIILETIFYFIIKGKHKVSVVCVSTIFILVLIFLLLTSTVTKQYIYKSPKGKTTIIAAQKMTVIGLERYVELYEKKFFILMREVPHPRWQWIKGVIDNKEDVKVTWLDGDKVLIEIPDSNYERIFELNKK